MNGSIKQLKNDEHSDQKHCHVYKASASYLNDIHHRLDVVRRKHHLYSNTWGLDSTMALSRKILGGEADERGPVERERV